LIDIAQFSKAYKEVLEILKYIPKQDYDKVPKYIIENMEKEQDREYKYNVTEFKNFERQEMLKETEAILSVLFREYWATEEQRKWIYEKERLEKRKFEQEKSKSYNSLNDMFLTVKNDMNENHLEEKIIKNNIQENKLQEIKKDNFWQKVITKIKKLLK